MRTLADLQQFDDPEGVAAAAGVSSAQWSLFGVLWPVGLVLARHVETLDLDGARVLELGCGLGLPSLVAARGGATVTATDIHPLAGEFLEHNARENNVDGLHFQQQDWCADSVDLDMFDLIIASDVMYEQGQADVLSAVCDRHLARPGTVIVADAGRKQHARFCRNMRALGFTEEFDRFGPGSDHALDLKGSLSVHTIVAGPS